MTLLPVMLAALLASSAPEPPPMPEPAGCADYMRPGTPVDACDEAIAAATDAKEKSVLLYRRAYIKIGRGEPIVVSVPGGSGGKVSTEVVRQDPLIAPIAKGQPMGTLRVKLGADTVAEVPLVALEDVEQAGFFGRMWDSIRLWIK